MSQSATHTLLIELVTEELPPKALVRLADAFANGLVEKLNASDLIAGTPDFESHASPRRLAVVIRQVRSAAPPKRVRQKILPISIALDAAGQATPALTKKLTKLGIADLTLAELERALDGKTEALFLNHTVPGAVLSEALQIALNETLAQLPIPKMMRYQASDGSFVQFVRPVHKLLALHGATVVPVSALGLKAGRTTLGHRFLSTHEITLMDADAYSNTLKQEGRVLTHFETRRATIRSQLLEQAGPAHINLPESLLDEVTALVEWPAVYLCHFDPAFLAVPQECLILTMQTNQKYFALTDANGSLQARFLVVSNLETTTPEKIIQGNERVVQARLADAKFFFEQDCKKPLSEKVAQLANVIYHHKLGSQLQRVERIEAIATALASQLKADPVQVARAARLAKADLLTAMVNEFPELQGTMGQYYARHDGEPMEVALACAEHYRPRFAGDTLPTSITSTIVALADKLETLVGIWGIGLAPCGDKDPFALRRHALGILRIVLEKALPLDLAQLLRAGFASFASVPEVTDPSAELLVFLLDRLRGLLRERGYHANEIEAVLSHAPTRIDDLPARLEAVRVFAALPEAQALAAANKRITNILKKSAEPTAAVQPTLLIEAVEKDLYVQLEALTPLIQTQLSAQQYTQVLITLAQLRTNVDSFFDKVMVNAEDSALRTNRLALLTQLWTLMNCVADLSKLATG
ncbi:glycine--tRNA ligase subunit beta [Mycoavidus sp. B2-EB]|uniref:glycine--tRNA ligase subunit beta n=1 Tax=Mycoavidus sp. B2-EB TaxID=2651972 RepID=UPI001629865D|nr:glycine--tRNA ligase subunit beta [Mycoavidus sp. B2-EB]BBO60175.1 glycine--tRNA ligase beta subunit [Mycoavidus sp. B2-EB]